MKSMKAEIKIGDRVRRIKDQPHWTCNEGTVENINEYNKASILWDKPAATGQQHSTLDIKVLKHLGN